MPAVRCGLNLPTDRDALARITGAHVHVEQMHREFVDVPFDPNRQPWQPQASDPAAARFWPAFWETIRRHQCNPTNTGYATAPLRAWQTAHPNAAHAGHAERALNAIADGDDPVALAFDVGATND